MHIGECNGNHETAQCRDHQTGVEERGDIYRQYLSNSPPTVEPGGLTVVACTICNSRGITYHTTRIERVCNNCQYYVAISRVGFKETIKILTGSTNTKA